MPGKEIFATKVSILDNKGRSGSVARKYCFISSGIRYEKFNGVSVRNFIFRKSENNILRLLFALLLRC